MEWWIIICRKNHELFHLLWRRWLPEACWKWRTTSCKKLNR